MAASLARRISFNSKGLSVILTKTTNTSLVNKRNSSDEIPNSKYGGRHTVTLIPADGIGPAMISGIKDVLRTAGVPMDFEVAELTGETPEEIMASFQDVKTSVKRNGSAIKGNWVTELGKIGGKSFNVAIRHDLDLYANIVKCKSYPTIKTRHSDVDLVIVRENTEGEYSNLEHENIPGVVEMMKIITEDSSKRIAKFAFEYAIQHERSKVTAVHKANIMKMSDGLFLNCCREVAQDYPDIEFNDMIIDNCAMQLVSRPEQFDVMVMPNLYGNVVTSIAAALIGGPGIPPGENHGDRYSIYESGTRNSGKEIADLNIANPMSMLLASTSMLRNLGLHRKAHLIDLCIHRIVTSGKARTSDIGGSTSTTEFFDILQSDIEVVRNRRSIQSVRR